MRDLSNQEVVMDYRKVKGSVRDSVRFESVIFPEVLVRSHWLGAQERHSGWKGCESIA